jgi:hypothetical protein
MPWHGESTDGKVYKYQYHPHGDKNQPLRAAPSAMNTVIVPNVTLPEVCRSYPLADKCAIVTVFANVPGGIEVPNIGKLAQTCALKVADHSVLSHRTSTRSSTSTGRRSGTTKRLLRSPLKDGARANGHLYVSDRLLYTRTVVTKGESCGWTCDCNYRRFVHSIRCSDKESIGNRSLHFICQMWSHCFRISCVF